MRVLHIIIGLLMFPFAVAGFFLAIPLAGLYAGGWLLMKAVDNRLENYK